LKEGILLKEEKRRKRGKDTFLTVLREKRDYIGNNLGLREVYPRNNGEYPSIPEHKVDIQACGP